MMEALGADTGRAKGVGASGALLYLPRGGDAVNFRVGSACAVLKSRKDDVRYPDRSQPERLATWAAMGGDAGHDLAGWLYRGQATALVEGIGHVDGTPARTVLQLLCQGASSGRQSLPTQCADVAQAGRNGAPAQPCRGPHGTLWLRRGTGV